MAIYSQAQVDEAIRKTLTPYVSHTYLVDGAEVPITLAPNIPTKYILPVSVKEINGFGLFDPGGPNQALQFQAIASNILFRLDASTSMTSSANNCNVKLMLYKNGSPVAGSTIKRKIGTGADTGAMSLDSTFRSSQNDILEVFVESDIATNLTFSLTSIVILEVN